MAHRDWLLGPRKHQVVWSIVNSDRAGTQCTIPIKVHTGLARAMSTLYHPFTPYPILHLPMGVSPGSLVSRMSHTQSLGSPHPESVPPLLTAEDPFQEDGCDHQLSGRSGVQFSPLPSPPLPVPPLLAGIQMWVKLETVLRSAQDGLL